MASEFLKLTLPSKAVLNVPFVNVIPEFIGNGYFSSDAIKIPKEVSDIFLSLLLPEPDKATVCLLEYNVNSVNFLMLVLKKAPSKT